MRFDRPYDFKPEDHEAELVAILRALDALPEVDGPRLFSVLRKHPKRPAGLYKKSELIRGLRRFADKYGWDAERLAAKIRMKPVRTHSGVAPVTVLTKPFACPGKCIFCPNDVRMPKSYLAMEPGAQRAAQNRFDPYAQTSARLLAFSVNGHRTDKVELIILGGTWSFYPEAYQRWFVKRCFDAMNEADPEAAQPSPPDPRFLDFSNLTPVADQPYNEVVRLPSRASLEIERSDWAALEEAQRINETARARCVGMVVETRPDHVDEAEVLRIRRLGATKVQLGYQSLDDRVLELNARGHDVAAARRATRLLRQAGFKIHAHWMPNLYGSDPKKDREDFARIFDDPDFRPDELKIYPCSLIETAELMQRYESGEYRPYEHEELVELLVDCMLRVPAYCRTTRVIRDIPSHDIVAGNKLSNLRELVEREIDKRGAACADIRAREIRQASVDPSELSLEEISYETGIGTEHFLQYVTGDDRIVAFLRLSLPRTASFVEELGSSAVIREVHVYGSVVGLDETDAARPQHAGLGRALIDRAAEIAASDGRRSMAVISSIGTRAYYEKLGFTRGELYQHRRLGTSRAD